MTKQIPGQSHRRCFCDDFFDLYVFYSPLGTIIGFHLCYGQEPNEKALTYSLLEGFSHDRVDDGNTHPYHYKMTPLLIPDGSFDKKRILRLFKERSKEIDPAVTDFVYRKTALYPGP